MAMTKLVCSIVASSVLLSVVAASADHSSVQVLGSDFDEKVGPLAGWLAGRSCIHESAAPE